MTYRILVDEAPVCETDWPPLAQAAWSRAVRQWSGAQARSRVVLKKDGRTLADVINRDPQAPEWPDRDEPPCDLRDVLKAILQLLRDDDWDAREIAEAMTNYGLPTTRARIDALRGGDRTRRAEVTAAEITVLLHAVLGEYKRGE